MFYLLNKQLKRVWREQTLLTQLWNKIKVYIRPFLHWKFLICFGLSYLIMNGWAYVSLYFAIRLKIDWLITILSTWVIILELPNMVGTLISLPLAIFFQTVLFPKDSKLNKELQEMKKCAKNDYRKFRMRKLYIGATK